MKTNDNVEEYDLRVYRDIRESTEYLEDTDDEHFLSPLLHVVAFCFSMLLPFFGVVLCFIYKGNHSRNIIWPVIGTIVGTVVNIYIFSAASCQHFWFISG